MTELWRLFWPGLAAGASAAALAGALSVLVVARRSAFATQGISHAAMAGAGVAAVIGLAGAGASLVVAASCLLAAAVIGALTSRGRTAPDTAVGVTLVASMALGALLIAWRLDHPIPGAPRPPSWESLFFGSILTVRAGEGVLAVGLAMAGLAAMWLWRRPLLMTTIDPIAARAAGMGDARAAMVFALLVGGAVVIAVKVVGVVLATALLVLPGAGALRLCRDVRSAFVVSLLAAEVGIGLGLWLSFETDAPPGAVSALALTGWWAVAGGLAAIRTRNAETAR